MHKMDFRNMYQVADMSIIVPSTFNTHQILSIWHTTITIDIVAVGFYGLEN